MRAHYEQHLRQIDRFLERRSCFSVLNMAYADVLAHPREQSARMAAFLGGGLDVNRMAAVADPSQHRHRHV